jgi:hypothetical protein
VKIVAGEAAGVATEVVAAEAAVVTEVVAAAEAAVATGVVAVETGIERLSARGFDFFRRNDRFPVHLHRFLSILKRNKRGDCLVRFMSIIMA